MEQLCSTGAVRTDVVIDRANAIVGGVRRTFKRGLQYVQVIPEGMGPVKGYGWVLFDASP